MLGEALLLVGGAWGSPEDSPEEALLLCGASEEEEAEGAEGGGELFSSSTTSPSALTPSASSRRRLLVRADVPSDEEVPEGGGDEEGIEWSEADGGDDDTLNASSADADGVESIAMASGSEAGAFGATGVLSLPSIAGGRSTRRARESWMRGRVRGNNEERGIKTEKTTSRREGRREVEDRWQASARRARAPLLTAVSARITNSMTALQWRRPKGSVWCAALEGVRCTSQRGTGEHSDRRDGGNARGRTRRASIDAYEDGLHRGVTLLIVSWCE